MPTPDFATIHVTRSFSASPEQVFDAWVDPAQVRQWMPAPALKMMAVPDEVVAIKVEARLGGTFSFVVKRQGEEIDHAGEYLAFDRPHRLSFTWGVPRYSPEMSVVTLELAPSATGTEVTLTCERVQKEYATQTEQGWSTILDAIADTLTA